MRQPGHMQDGQVSEDDMLREEEEEEEGGEVKRGNICCSFW